MFDKIVARPTAASVSTPVPTRRWSLRRIGRALLAWHEFRRSRRELLALDDRMLEDVGLTRKDVCGVSYFDLRER